MNFCRSRDSGRLWPVLLLVNCFVSFLFKLLFIFGCAGSLLLLRLFLVAVHGPLIVVASIIVEHKLYNTCYSCNTWA